MTKLACDPMCGKKKTSGRMLGVCYIISMTSPYYFFGPYIRWEDLPMVLCIGFAHGFGHDGFLPMVSSRSGQGNYGYVLIQG